MTAFKMDFYKLDEFPGPKPGENAVEFTATTLNGDKVKLSDYHGKAVVLETGSISCPMYVKEVPPMNILSKKFSDVQFLVLYVREAHPGSKIPRHKSLDDKLSQAKRLSLEENENRIIIVDDVDGTAHKLYGSLPNMVYIINAEGTVIFRSIWANYKDVEMVLSDDSNKVHHGEQDEPSNPPFFLLIRVMLRAGWNALWDIIVSLPQMKRARKKSEELRSTDK